MKSPKPFRYWFVLHPDISSPIGGVKQIHRLAEGLVHTGRSATIIQDSASFHPGWFTSNVATVSKSDLFKRTDLHPSKDIFILPETYAPRFSTYCPSFPKIIFNQNGSYSFGTNSSKGWFKVSRLLHLYSHPEIKRILTVSEYDSNLLVNGFSIPAERVGLIVNPIGDMPKILPSRKAKSIVYFTRKNQKDVSIVVEMIKHSGFANDWSFLPISNLPHSQVLNAFQSSWLYLSFGHPEGFGLPVAEALANGCAVVGYTGLGRELLSLRISSVMLTQLNLVIGLVLFLQPMTLLLVIRIIIINCFPIPLVLRKLYDQNILILPLLNLCRGTLINLRSL